MIVEAFKDLAASSGSKNAGDYRVLYEIANQIIANVNIARMARCRLFKHYFA
jgi:hypothetical protein